MNVIIIEDEKLSADHLSTLLKRIDKTINVVTVFDSIKKSVEAFEKGISADVLFVDIHLADGLSFDIFTKINIETPVIFTTAYNEYAIKAFKFNSIDYLLKPIGISDLKAALEKYNRLNVAKTGFPFKEIAGVYETITKQFKNRFMVKMGDNIVSVKSEDVAHFIAEEGIVLLSTKNDKRYAIDYTLDQLEELLDPKQFFRINRKVFMNIGSIQKISTYFNSRLKLVSAGLSEEDCIVSRERVNDFKAWLDN
ncbi:MAG: response regulator transcription factor [Bacteroidia bacterium]|nr:response regulator transcription factor [Bacteroidia bacterium]